MRRRCAKDLIKELEGYFNLPIIGDERLTIMLKGADQVLPLPCIGVHVE
jgi:hypothetical protein